jgi:hypothetical protein
MRAFEAEIKDALHDYFRAARDPAAPVPMAQRSTGTFLLRTLSALRRYRIPIAVSTMQLYRTILIADVVMLRLDSRIDWVGEMEDFLVEQTAELVEAAFVAPVEDSDVLFTALDVPQVLSEGIDWMNRRLLAEPREPPLVRDAVNELVLTGARLLRLALAAVLVIGLALWTGLLSVPADGWASGFASWLDGNPLLAIVLFGGGELMVQSWVRRVGS